MSRYWKVKGGVVVAIACLSNVDASNVRDEVVCLAGEGEDNENDDE